MRLYLFAFIIFCFLIPESIKAQGADSLVLKLKSTLYLDLETFVLASNASINYEVAFTEHALFRLGYGLGYLAQFDHGIATSSGLLAMMNFVSAAGNSRFEGGLGGSIVLVKNYFNDSDGWKILPAFALGYRYQPQLGGILFRVGFGYTYAFGFPIYISLGSTI